jgi:hypothetical protein
MRAIIAITAFLIGCGDNATPAPTRDAYVGGDSAPLTCAPNLDGRIEAFELTPALDTPVQYLINPVGKDRTVDLVGRVESGRRVFRFDVDFADDQALTLKATTLSGKWYSASFPTGEFVTQIDTANDGIYRHDDAGLFLLGLASKNEAEKTLIVYAEPVAVMRFPLALGSKWTSIGNVSNATIRGLPYAGRDTYEVEDDAVGKLVLHDFTFEQVHRVRTKVTVAPSAGAAVTRRQVSYFAECFGEVVHVVSKDNEPNADFTVAAELRRLGQ